MNKLLKNVAGQHVDFVALDGSNLPLTGLTYSGLVALDGGAFAAAGGGTSEIGHGVYRFTPSQADTNGDVVSFLLWETGTAGPTFVQDYRTEGTVSVGDVVLAAAQPHYAPAKAGEAMALVAGQDVRNILGSVAGDLAGDVLGDVPSPTTLSAGAIDALLDHANGIQTGVSIRQGFRQLVAALVNVQVAFALSAHTGPTNPSLKPKFPGSARQRLAAATADLLKVVALNQEQPELGLLAPNLATACQQLATALDSVRTSSA